MMHTARVLADSLSPRGVRLTTFEATYPRIVHAEMMTHRQLSRNAASSRAIPVQKMIQQVVENPYIPGTWGKNQKGMQAGEPIDAMNARQADTAWLKARDLAVEQASKLLELGVHKQLTNRLLEPFMWYTAIITATELSNFFNLRCHPDAHPDIRIIAEKMRDAMQQSTPQEMKYGQWHVPLVDEWTHVRDGDVHEQDKYWTKVSVGRCARVSYLTHDGKRDPEADITLHDRLLGAGHMCFDKETEVLTSEGWLKWPAVYSRQQDSSLLVLAVDIETETARWESPEALHRYAVNEPLYRVYGQQLDQLVTANHRLVVSSRVSGGGWTSNRFQTAREVAEKPVRYLKAVQGVTTDVSRLPLPTITEIPDFFRFLGFAIGDGYADGGNQIQFHLRKKRKVAFLKSLALTVRSLKHDKYVVEHPGLGSWFRDNCYDTDGVKSLPWWVLSLHEKDVNNLLQGLRESDGSARRNTWVFSTTSQQVADVLQALLALHGKTGSLSYSPYGNKQAVRVNVSNRIRPRVEVNQKGRALSYKESWEHYTGKVYCATVSTGALLVRRNGHVVVSGNSPFEHVARPATDADAYEYAALGRNFYGNFRGWVQYRKLIPGEHDILAAKEEA